MAFPRKYWKAALILSLAEVTPVFKKDDELSKENYRLVSVLSRASKTFERVE